MDYTQPTALALIMHYRREAGRRTSKSTAFLRVDQPNRIAAQLVSWADQPEEAPELARNYISAQFASMPEGWCLDRFKIPYPPSRVCFSKGGWDRFVNYMRRDPSDG